MKIFQLSIGTYLSYLCLFSCDFMGMVKTKFKGIVRTAILVRVTYSSV